MKVSASNIWLSFSSTVRRQDIGFTITWLICRSWVMIIWYASSNIPTSCVTFVIISSISECIIFCIHTMPLNFLHKCLVLKFLAHGSWSCQCRRWIVFFDGGRLQRISIHYWNGDTTQMSGINLDRTLQKEISDVRNFRVGSSKTKADIRAHTLLNINIL